MATEENGGFVPPNKDQYLRNRMGGDEPASESGSPKKPSSEEPILTARTGENPIEEELLGKTPVPPVKYTDRTKFDSPETDKAIDDILINESDEVLAQEDTLNKSSLLNVKKKSKKGKKTGFKKILNKWSLITLGVIIVLIFAIPLTRYPILATFISRNYTVELKDSGTGLPVSDAKVTYGRKSYKSSAQGDVTINAPVGKRSIDISKSYYKSTSLNIFVGLFGKNSTTVNLLATGREVPMQVINGLTNKPVSGAKVSVDGASSITNSNGKLSMVLPTKHFSYQAKVSAANFNSVQATVKVTTQLGVNVIRIIPSGNVYFLNGGSGSINVYKANLDGSNPRILVAGTGSETVQTSKLWTSPDGKYLVLQSIRTGSTPALYAISTSSGQINQFDSSNASFNFIGWNGDNFIYDLTSNTTPTSSNGHQQVKSYDAQHQQLTTLDQSQVVNGSNGSYAYQALSSFNLTSNSLLYAVVWNSVNGYSLNQLNDSLRSVQTDGTNKSNLQTFAANNVGTLKIITQTPTNIYAEAQVNNQQNYYSYQNGSFTQNSSINSGLFTSNQPVLYESPTQKFTAYSASNGGQSQVYITVTNSYNPKSISKFSGYEVYGWFSDSYILLMQGNQLYSAPENGTSSPTLIGQFIP